MNRKKLNVVHSFWFHTMLGLSAKSKPTSHNFVGGHLKVEGLAESHLMPVHGQSYAQLIHPQPKTNLALANESDLLASE